jgi:thioredoxin reductase (NADPH)
MGLYDLIIIGCGPAGLTASIYASCFGLRHLVIGSVLGGQMINAPDILNYPGFEEISGKELTKRMVSQVEKRGGEIIVDSVGNISAGLAAQSSNNPITQSTNNPINDNRNVILNEVKNPVGHSKNLGDPSSVNRRTQDDIVETNIFEIETQDGKKYQCKAIILATGTERRKLNVPGETEYTGRGIYYCATCAKVEYEGKICAVVGGGNSAVQGAVQLSQAASKIYIIYRGTELRGDPVWLEQIKKSKKIEVIYSAIVTEIVGDGSKVTGVKLQTTDNRQQITNNPNVILNEVKNPISNYKNEENPSATPQDDKVLPLDKIFIEIGGIPGMALVIPLGVATDERGYIKVNEKLETNLPGVFAAGDLVSSGMSIEQISTAVGLGARAASSAFSFLKSDKAPTVWGKSQIKR